jgi:hypothetical protein
MARKHVLLISLAVAAALVAGVFAAVRTTELGVSATTGGVSDADLTTRDRQLDRIAKRVRAQAQKRPPKLPSLRLPSGSSGSGGLGNSRLSSSGSTPQLVVSSSGPGPSGHHDDDDDHDRFDDRGHDRDDDHSGHGHGGDRVDDHSGHGRGGDDERDHD